MTDSQENVAIEPYQPRVSAADVPCKVCGAPSIAVGYCRKCYGRDYQRQQRAGLKVNKKAHRPCLVDGCERNAGSGGMCPAHWQRNKLGQDLNTPIKTATKVPDAPCTVPGCEEPQRCKSLCERHYNRLLTTGKLETTTLRASDEWDRAAQRCFRKIQGDVHRVRRTQRDRWEIWIQRKSENIRNRIKTSTFYLAGHTPKKQRKRQVNGWHSWSIRSMRRLSSERWNANRDKWDQWAQRKSTRQNQRIAKRR